MDAANRSVHSPLRAPHFSAGTRCTIRALFTPQHQVEPMMRIVTWNCCGGIFQEQAAHVTALMPDVAVIQEAPQPHSANLPNCAWSGADSKKKGVTVVGANGYTLEAYPPAPSAPCDFFPVRVVGPTSFMLLAAWTHTPKYVEDVWPAVDAYRGVLTPGECVLAGDFNSSSHPKFDRKHPRATHAMMVEMLERELGLVSAYHAFFDVKHGSEEHPTYYHCRDKSKPFHIDYCFIPKAWSRQIRSVVVGDFAGWQDLSDHRPLIVDVEPLT